MSIRVMALVWERPDLDPYERLMMLSLADHADDEGVCFPSIARLCARTGMKERGAQTVLKRLAEKGHLRVEMNAGRKGTNRYIITLTPAPDAPRTRCTPAQDAPITPAPDAGASDAPPHSTAKTPAPDAPEPSRTVIAVAAVRAPEREPDEPLLRRVLRAVRLNEADILPAYWMPPGAEMHIQRQWVSALGLTPDEIVAVAEAERSRHDESPRGPVALDGAMRRLAGQKLAAPLAAIQAPEGRAAAPPRGLSEDQFNAAFFGSR